MAFKQIKINESSLFPLKLNYPLNANETFVYTKDGYSFYYYTFFNELNDATAQKESSLLLTQKANLKNFYIPTKQTVDNFKLGIYAFLKFSNSNKYVTGTFAPTLSAAKYYTTGDMIYFRVNTDNTVTMFLRNQVVTVDTAYPYVINLQPENVNDIYNQQKFEFVQEGNNIVISTIVIDRDTKQRVKRFISYSQVDNTLRAIGSVFGAYNSNEYYLTLDGKITLFYPDYLSESLAVEYYNSLGDVNLQNLEIKNKIPTGDTNFLVHVPYKKETALITLSSNAQYFDVPAEIITLKNILTPSHNVAKQVQPPQTGEFDPSKIFYEIDSSVVYNKPNLQLIFNNIPDNVKHGTFPYLKSTNYGLTFPYRGGTKQPSDYVYPTYKRDIGITTSGILLKNYVSDYTPLTAYDYDIYFCSLSGIDFSGGVVGLDNKYKYITTDFLNNNCWGNIVMFNRYYNSILTQPDGHSKILGIAFDGYPIYGPYGYVDPFNPKSGVKRMQSGYALLTSVDTERPSYNTYPRGTFIQDYTYVKKPNVLDDHNGRYCVTPEYPNGTYAYFATIDKNNKPVFPYFIGSSFYGNCSIRSISSIDLTTGAVQPPPLTSVAPNPNIRGAITSNRYTFVYGVGENLYGQLGNGQSKNTYNLIFALSGQFDKITAGGTHVLYLSSGLIYGTGNNTNGQLGLPQNITQVTNLTRLKGPWEDTKTPIIDVFAGGNSSFAIDANKNVYATGDNTFWQLGSQSLGKVFVYGWKRVSYNLRKVVPSETFSLAIDNNNKLFVTGSNSSGQLANVNVKRSLTNWTPITSNLKFSDVAAGRNHAIGVCYTDFGDQLLYVIGDNSYGQLGLNYTPLTADAQPYLTDWYNVPSIPYYSILGVTCGLNSSYVLVSAAVGDTAGKVVYVAGDNSYNQLGLGGGIWPYPVPGRVGIGYTASYAGTYRFNNKITSWVRTVCAEKVVAGQYHVAVLSANGGISTSGYNKSGELGLGNTVIYYTDPNSSVLAGRSNVRSTNIPNNLGNQLSSLPPLSGGPYNDVIIGSFGQFTLATRIVTLTSATTVVSI